MLTCIACSKQQLRDAGDDTPRGTPTTKPAVKSLTSQIKDVVLKLSGAYKQCKAGGPSTPTPYRPKSHIYRSYYDDFLDVEGGLANGGNVKKPRDGSNSTRYPSSTSKGGSSSTTPSWDFSRATSEPRKLTNFESWVPGMEPEAPEVDGCEPPVMVDEQDDGPKEWVAQVEPGVHITFLALPQGGNDLKRIRFSRDFFNKLEAQRWWGENYDRIMELYNVQRFNKHALPTPPRSEDERDMSYSRMGSRKESPGTSATTTYFNSKPVAASSSNGVGAPRCHYPTPDPTEHFFPQYQIQNGAMGFGTGSGPPPVKGEGLSVDASRTTTSSRDEPLMSNASDMLDVTEWVQEDEPGVYITIRQMPDGTRDLRRVRFSRERFGEINAKLWWEENRERIHAQYL